MNNKTNTMGTGTGKGTGSSREPITDARNIGRLAESGAKRFARKIEAASGRVLQPCEVEEAAAIHRAELVRVYAMGAAIPEADALTGYAAELWRHKQYSHPGRKRSRLYARPFALARHAMRRAGKRARAMVHGGGMEDFTFLPLESRPFLGPFEGYGGKDSLQTTQAFIAETSGVRSAWASVSGATTAGGEKLFSREWTRERMKGKYEDDRLRLAVYWARKGGQGWEGDLARGLRLLGAVYQSITGRGCSGLLSLGYSIEAASRRQDRQTLTKAVAALRAKVSGGEWEIRNNPQAVSNTLHYLEIIADTPAASREAVARLRARLVNVASVNLASDYREAAADRVARRHAWQRAAGVGLWGRGEWEDAKGGRVEVVARKLGEAGAMFAPSIIPGVRVIVARSKAVAGNTLQLSSTLPSGTAAAAWASAFTLNRYALELIGQG